MLRGTLVLFAGAFTVLILRRQLFIHHWLGMVLITAGAALVGASSVLYANPTANGGALGSMSPQPGSMVMMQPQAWGVPAGGAAAGAVLNGTLAAGSSSSGLHYDPGLSRVASRGMLGVVMPGPGTAPTSSGGGVRPGVVPGLHAWSAALGEGPDVAAAPLFGDLLVVGAQMFTALQFILEEKFLVKYKV